MKALTTPAILTRFSSRVDGSLSFGGITPELTTAEKVALMDLHNKNVVILIQLTDDSAPEEMIRVKGGLEIKSPGRRLRDVLFVLYRQQNPLDTTFENFYSSYLERLISSVKEKIVTLRPE